MDDKKVNIELTRGKIGNEKNKKRQQIKVNYTLPPSDYFNTVTNRSLEFRYG